MPITSSAKKALRASKRKKVFNIRTKSLLDTQVKTIRKAISANDKKGAVKMLPTVFKSLDKASKTGYIKANTASRLKSRLSIALNKIA